MRFFCGSISSAHDNVVILLNCCYQAINNHLPLYVVKLSGRNAVLI